MMDYLVETLWLNHVTTFIFAPVLSPFTVIITITLLGCLLLRDHTSLVEAGEILLSGVNHHVIIITQPGELHYML
jgi:hypothetical protein